MQPNQPGTGVTPDYSFITSPDQSAPKSPLFGGKGMLGRVIIVGVGLIVLLIVFSVVKNLLSTSNVPELTSVLQDQTELTHLVTNALQQQGISTPNLNFADTARLAVQTERSQTIMYLNKNRIKVNKKLITAKESAVTDSALSTAAADANFNQAFHDVMQKQLTIYQADLRAAYKVTKGPNGRALLTKNYNDAALLLQQLNS